ncbi:MAG: hypothetical protein J0L99_14690 [Chitinophagales bacterium]|nr:hypothetical protein [Chitinophagales bacterium]
MPNYEDYIFKGFYPRIYDLDLDPSDWLQNYLKIYAEPLSDASPSESYLIYGGDEIQKRSVAQVLGWKNLYDIPL